MIRIVPRPILQAAAMDVLRPLPHPPAYEDLIWRPLWPADVSAIYRLISAIGKENGVSPVGSTADYAAYFTDSATNSGQDSLAAVTPNGAVVALGWAMPNPDYRDELRIDLWVDVYPAYRHRWLDRFLLEWLAARADQIRATQANGRPCWMNVPSDWQERGRMALIESSGVHGPPQRANHGARPGPAHPGGRAAGGHPSGFLDPGPQRAAAPDLQRLFRRPDGRARGQRGKLGDPFFRREPGPRRNVDRPGWRYRASD